MRIVTYYIRPDHRMPVGLQLAMINEHGRTAEEQIWNEAEPLESWQDAVNDCDAGEAIGVCGLHRIPGTMTDLVRVFDELTADGKSVYDLERQTFIDSGSAASWAEAWRVKNGIARIPDDDEARRRQALGLRGGWRKMTKAQRAASIKVFTDAETITLGAELLGISRSTANRWISEGWLPPHPSTVGRNKR